MKVQWEGQDIRAGRRVWKDMECMICDDPHREFRPTLVVLKTGRIMFSGDWKAMAEYLTEHEYRPTEDR